MKLKKIVSLIIVFIFFILLLMCVIGSLRKNIKIGLIAFSDESDIFTSTNIDGIIQAVENAGINRKKLTIVKNVDQESCYKAINELTEKGCKLIFGIDSVFEDYFVQKATETPKVNYCVLKGKQINNGLSNYHSFSFPEYQTRYVMGVAAALKLNDMLENGEISKQELQLGYIASFPDAENISAYSAFYLGAKSIFNDIALKVQYTYSEADESLNSKAALALIANGCKIISQQSYLFKPEKVCSDNGVAFIGLLNNNKSQNNEQYLCDGLLDMSGCYSYAIEKMINKDDIPNEWSVATCTEESLFVSSLNENSFVSKKRYDDTEAKIKDIEKQIKDNSLKVFDINNWTVNGTTITSTITEEYEEKYNSQEYINDSYFMENEITSNPRFEFKIDGITELNLMDDYSL